jgi:hypothetical protein
MSIATLTFVPVIFPEPKSITSSELGNAFFYTFEINNKTFYLFLYSRYDEPITPNISFNKVNFVSTDEIESEEFPELEYIFSKTNSENFFSLEHHNKKALALLPSPPSSETSAAPSFRKRKASF